MRAFVWLLLAVNGFLCSALRPETGFEYTLEADKISKVFQGATQETLREDSLFRLQNTSGGCTKSEEEAIQLLATLWGYGSLNINGSPCKAKSRVKFGHGFDVTCQNGSISIIAVKKKWQTKISDLIPALCGLPELRQIILDGSNVTGRLAELKAWKGFEKLERLHMRWCNIDGELKEIPSFKNLRALKLSGPGIRGSLEDLGQEFWTKAVFLDLRKTSVTGDVPQDSAPSSSLVGLWLQNTSITGDVMKILRKHRGLKYLHLPRTKVSGTLTDPEGDEGKDLRELDLSNSDIQFRMEVNETHAPYPHLAKLDLTGCNLSMDVWEFLKPLALHSYHLVDLKAANCSLSGKVKGIFAGDNRPLMWQINVLDLSYNDITALSGKARQCWIDVSHNQKLATIDRSYFKVTNMLDLRDTPYNATEAEAWEFLEPEEVDSQSFRCKGVRPKDANDNGISRGRVLVTPSKFDRKTLCKCSLQEMAVVEEKNCCGCFNGSVLMDVDLPYGNSTVGGKWCVTCLGPGCDHVLCAEESEEGNQCVKGYRGALCAACEQNYHSTGFARCAKCREVEQTARVPLICLVATIAVLVISGSLYKWVVQEPETNTTPTENGNRSVELLEQGLLVWSYSQLLMAIVSLQWRMLGRTDNVQPSPLQRVLKDFIMLDVTWLLDALSVQCMLGYEEGRNLEVLVGSFFLPALVLVALALSACIPHSSSRQSPFYGLKYVIVVTSIAFQATMKQTWGNLYWCETQSAGGWALGKDSFLSQRPWIKCSGAMSDDHLRSMLLVALGINGLVIPGSLCLLGFYLSRLIREIQVLSASLSPVIQCESHPQPHQADGIEHQDKVDGDTVTLQFATIQVAADKLPLTKAKLGNYEEFSAQVIWLHAAAHVVCIANSLGTEKVQVVEAHFNGVESLHILKLGLTKGPNFQAMTESSQKAALQDAQREAQKLSKRLVYRAMAKEVTQGQMEPIWIGTRNSFERFADKDPLLCEGLWKFFLLSVTKMCLGGEGGNAPMQMMWIATMMAASTLGIRITEPFGSPSRNALATVCFGSLFFTSFIAALLSFPDDAIPFIQMPKNREPLKFLTLLPSIAVILFFIHLQLMPGDIMLQANWLHGEMKKLIVPDNEGKAQKENVDVKKALTLKAREWGSKSEETGSESSSSQEVGSESSGMVAWYRGLVSAAWYRRRSST